MNVFILCTLCIVDQLISEGVQVKSSIWEFRMRSSQGSCICTCRG